jgi:hypothetical protein
VLKDKKAAVLFAAFNINIALAEQALFISMNYA